VIRYLENGNHQKQDNYEFMREMWSIGEDALHGLDIAEQGHGVVGHLRDIWYLPVNSKTVNLAQGGPSVNVADILHMSSSSKNPPFVMWAVSTLVFMFRFAMVLFGVPVDFMIVFFGCVTKMALMPFILALRFAKLDYHIPRSMSFSFDKKNFFYPATEHFVVSRTIIHTLNDHLRSIGGNYDMTYFFAQKIPCFGCFMITFIQLGLTGTGLKSLVSFEGDWKELKYSDTRKVLKVSFQFLVIAKLLEVFANAEISRRSCSEKPWEEETVEWGPEWMNWEGKGDPFKVVKGSVETVKLHSYTRIFAGLSFVVYGFAQLHGLGHDGRMPALGVMGEAIPILSFSILSALLAPDMTNAEKPEYSFFDMGLGPISMRVAQQVDNLASLLEPIFYLMYSGQKNFTLWRTSDEVPKKSDWADVVQICNYGGSIYEFT